MDYQLQVVTVPVTDVDQAAAFYTQKAGFALDVDYHPTPGFRVVQLTPPGSACSIQIGVGLTDAPPGSARATYLAVTDIEAARRELVERGVSVSAVRHKSPIDGWKGDWQPGADPQRRDYASLAGFTDPDGNTWVLQEIGFRAPAPLPAANPDLNYSHPAIQGGGIPLTPERLPYRRRGDREQAATSATPASVRHQRGERMR